MSKPTIAVFQISTEEDLRFQLDFQGLSLTGRTLRVNVRRRDTGALVQALTSPSNMTLAGSGNLTVFYPKASMSSWAKTEYEADLIDETGGSFTRIMAVRFVYDEPGKLVYGVRGNQATVTFANNQATVTAIGGVGPPGPANVITIGDVETLETGAPATASLTGSAPTQVLNLGLPKGNTGTAATVAVGTVTTRSPGSGATVANSGTSGAAVLDFGIPAGAAATVAVGTVTTGPAGSSAAVTNAGTTAAATLNFTIPRGDKGEKGWSPEFAIVADDQRRVIQVTDWAGGEGTKPATGEYVGATGLVADIKDAVDIRGPEGAAVSPGSISTTDLVDGVLSADTTGRAKMADGYLTAAKAADGFLSADTTGRAKMADGYLTTAKAADGFLSADTTGRAKMADGFATNAKLATVATATIKGRTTAGTGAPEDLSAAQAAGVIGAVRYSAAQSLSDAEKLQARANLGGSYVLERAVASGATSVEFTLPSGFSLFEFDIAGFVCDAAAVLEAQLSVDGTTYKTGGTDYFYLPVITGATNTSPVGFLNNDDGWAYLIPDIPAANPTFSGIGKLTLSPGSATQYPSMHYVGGPYSQASGRAQTVTGSGWLNFVGPAQKIKFYAPGRVFNGVFVMKGIV